jgi:hypothetical protein
MPSIRLRIRRIFANIRNAIMPRRNAKKARIMSNTIGKVEVRKGIAESIECKPIDNIDDLLSWTPESVDERLIGNKLTMKRDKSDTRQLLLCHDMKGGYLEDR